MSHVTFLQKKTHQRTEPPENASKLSCGRGLQHAIQTGQHIWRKGVASYAAPTPTLFRYPVSTCFCLVGCPHSPSEAFWFKWMLQLVPKRLKLIHFSRGCGLFRRVRTALDVSAPPPQHTYTYTRSFIVKHCKWGDADESQKHSKTISA